ncbi:MAG: HlyC/CorC family transporter [Magnetococcales bacterium]|nr:HlyC/CorC family transporter [Magnetococcales bacterium]
MDISVIILLMIGCLMMEAFFSGAEIGVVSADRIKLRHDAAKGNKGAKLALEMLDNPEFLLSTTLVGTNIAIVTNTTLATLLAVQLFGKENSWAAIAIVAPLIWVFGEIVPKSIFQQKANTITPRVIYILKGASYLFYPILLIFTWVTRLLTHLTGARGNTPFTLKKEIDIILKMPASGGDVRQEEKTMIRRMFNFGETKVRDIAKPLIDITAIPHNITCGEASIIAWKSSHIRLPVYKGQIYHIIGIYNARENMREAKEDLIEPLIEPVRFVSSSKSVEDLLVEFQESGIRFAVMIDEYGAAEGIITMEDIMERIVGDLEDEYDLGKPVSSDWVTKKSDRDLLANPRIDLITLSEDWGITIPDGPYETLSGFLMELAGDIPHKGQILNYKQFSFTIESADEKRAREVRIRW